MRRNRDDRLLNASDNMAVDIIPLIAETDGDKRLILLVQRGWLQTQGLARSLSFSIPSSGRETTLVCLFAS